MNKEAKGRPFTGRKKYTIMCHPCRITEAREYIKKLKPKKFVPYFISGGCKGEICTVCGKDATNKLGEEIPFDDPDKMRHNLTAYVCREHFTMIVGGC